MKQINKIFHKNCIEGMKELPDHSVDLVIADPPYNLSKGNNLKWDASIKLQGFGGMWNKVMENWDNMDFIDYWNFTFSWLSEIKRVLKPTGSLWVFGTYHNIGIINVVLQLLKIEIINEVIWFKRNSFPNLAGRRLTASHETLLWAHSGNGKRQYYFNYEFSKKSYFPEDQIKKADKQMRTIWDIPNNKSSIELKFGKHPTQKPLKVISRIINIASKPDDLCLVPFSGAGSECVAAKALGRNFIAYETDESYIEIANKRLKNTQKSDLTLFECSNNDSNGHVKLKVNSQSFRELMKSRNINSLSDLAVKSDVSKPKIHQYLRGDSPLATTYMRLCNFFEIDPNDILELEDRGLKQL